MDLDSILGKMLSEVKNKSGSTNKKKKIGKQKHKDKLRAGEEKKSGKKDLNKWKNPPPNEWKHEAIVMTMYHATCSCCGHEYEMPNRWLFIRRWHWKLGYHYEKLSNRLDIEAARYSMPKLTEHEHVAVQSCPLCFDLEGIIEQAKCNKCPTIQLDFFNS